MHILVLPSWYPEYSGDISGVFFSEQAQALGRAGHKVGVIAPRLRPRCQWGEVVSDSYRNRLEVEDGIPTLRTSTIAWLPSFPKLTNWLWVRHGRRAFRRYVRVHGIPDLIHVHSMLNAGLLALSIKKCHRIPYVVTEHSTSYARGRLDHEQLRIARSIAAGAARRLAVSRPFCDLLEKKVGCGSGPWEEMPNIVHQSFIEVPLPEPRADGGAFRFVTVALLSRKKGVDNLIRAFAKNFAGDRSVSLDVGGDGEDRQLLEALAAEEGVADRVQFLGRLDRRQVADTIARGDAFVLPSRYETFGVVLIEALALGKPVIATRCGGPESIVREEDGLLIPPDDIPGLAWAMGTLRSEIRRYRAAEIRHGCVTRFSEQVVVGRLNTVFQEVVQGHEGN